MDRFTRQKRSKIMSAIRGKDTAPEILVRKVMHSMGYRFRLHDRSLPGCPDIVLPRHRVVVFVNGCFWHGHARCRRAALPATRPEFWKNKIGRNCVRDKANRQALRLLGWRVLVIWQCKAKNPEEVRRIIRAFFTR